MMLIEPGISCGEVALMEPVSGVTFCELWGESSVLELDVTRMKVTRTKKDGSKEVHKITKVTDTHISFEPFQL